MKGNMGGPCIDSQLGRIITYFLGSIRMESSVDSTPEQSCSSLYIPIYIIQDQGNKSRSLLVAKLCKAY